MHRRNFIGSALLASTSALAAGAASSSRGADPSSLLQQPRQRFAPTGIWDAFYWGSLQERAGGSLSDALDAEKGPLLDAGITRQCIFLHVGAGTARPEFEQRIRDNPDDIRAALTRHKDRLLGIARITADDVPASLAAIDTWIARGPMIGIGLIDGKIFGAHANFDPLIRRAVELGAIVAQLTWFNTLEAAKGEEGSTPSTLAVLAARHPDATFICTHAGGEWEKGIRAIRSHRNVLVETSGFDPTAGFVEMAVRELGAERVMFGSHYPGRSLATEFSKVLGAGIADRDKELIFSGNLRRLLAPILRRKGLAGG